MIPSRSSKNADPPLVRDLLHLARYYLGSRRAMLGLAGLALVAGFALNWSWLVAAGIAPILIGVLPCVAMCALGLCMNKLGGKSCSTGDAERNAGTGIDTLPREDLANPTLLPAARDNALAAGGDTAHGTNHETQTSKERNTTDA